jgi:hypothetical protein
LAIDFVQIAASYDSSGNPIVYALSYYPPLYGTVWVLDGGWHNLGYNPDGYALEISAGRDADVTVQGDLGPTQNIFYAIGQNHHVYVYNNSASSTWGTGYWTNLGGYATALTPEAIHLNSFDGAFADAPDHKAYEWYGLSWHGLLGPQLNTSYTPLAY